MSTKNLNHNARYWVVIPAAGIGSRLPGDCAKQYINLLGVPMLQRTLDCFLSDERIEKVMVALHSNDQHWSALGIAQHVKVLSTVGGATRAQSVSNALAALSALADPNDWVLVHDAARPCLSQSALDRLIDALSQHAVGGLLGRPVSDTMKRVTDSGDVINTVSRENLWHAQTPQMFRYGVLVEALKKASQDGFIVTDEASAIEYIGLQPKIVLGDSNNIKVTYPEDIDSVETRLKAAEVVCV